MSHFKKTFKINGKDVEVECLDDYFGKHRYGYKVGDVVYTEELFNKFINKE